MTSTPTAPAVFRRCGVDIPLISANLPDNITIRHPVAEAFKNFAKRREDRNGCDDILSNTIPFFNNLFNSNMRECATGEINLSNEFCEFDLATLESLLDYAYTGRLIISTTNAQDLMIGAHFFQMAQVIDECAQFMRMFITIDNVFPLLHCCRSIGYDKIDRYLLRFIDKNFVPISLTADFLELSVDDLTFILDRDALNVDDEKQVFEALARWIECDFDRRQYAAELLKYVRCPQIPATFISETIEKLAWVKDDDECMALVNEAKIQKQINNKEGGSQLPPFKIAPRVWDNAHQLFISMSCDFTEKDQSVTPFHFYDPLTDTWTECQSARPESYSLDYVYIFKDKIFISEVLDEENVTTAIFDTISNEWHTEKDYIDKIMSNNPEIHFPLRRVLTAASAVIDDKPYAIGGEDEEDDSALATLETFDFAKKEWTPLKSMSSRRVYPACCVLEEKLYVFGGRNDDHTLRDAECYDPATDSWSPISPMKYKREHAIAAVLHGQIYVVGGEPIPF